MTPDEIIARCEALGLSGPALARAVGVSESTVWRWKRGKGISALAQRQLESTFRRLERRARPAPGAEEVGGWITKAEAEAMVLGVMRPPGAEEAGDAPA